MPSILAIFFIKAMFRPFRGSIKMLLLIVEQFSYLIILRMFLVLFQKYLFIANEFYFTMQMYVETSCWSVLITAILN